MNFLGLFSGNYFKSGKSLERYLDKELSNFNQKKTTCLEMLPILHFKKNQISIVMTKQARSEFKSCYDVVVSSEKVVKGNNLKLIEKIKEIFDKILTTFDAPKEVRVKPDTVQGMKEKRGMFEAFKESFFLMEELFLRDSAEIQNEVLAFHHTQDKNQKRLIYSVKNLTLDILLTKRSDEIEFHVVFKVPKYDFSLNLSWELDRFLEKSFKDTMRYSSTYYRTVEIRDSIFNKPVQPNKSDKDEEVCLIG